jgi:tRNA threonylcarbamoyladenosine biosynthesis protein TsaE
VISLPTFAANGKITMAEWKFTLDKLPAVAADFRQQFADQKVFAFHGAMGAGKTTFIHALCDVMKVTSTVGSPTFSIINEYGYSGGTVYHIDLYRLRDEEEAIRAGVEDCLYSGNTCLVEWPNRAAALFPPGTVQVYLEATDDQIRLMRVEDK